MNKTFWGTGNETTKTSKKKQYTIYSITCKRNGKKYIGVTCNYQARINVHIQKPPPKMLADARQYTPFLSNFSFDVLYKTRFRDLAMSIERFHIKNNKTTSKLGYNVLKGNPRHCSKYYFLKTNNRIWVISFHFSVL